MPSACPTSLSPPNGVHRAALGMMRVRGGELCVLEGTLREEALGVYRALVSEFITLAPSLHSVPQFPQLVK